MNTTILLFAAILAAEGTTPVQAKVLYGTDVGQQQRADIELWISQAVARYGAPLTQPYTNWIPLNAEQRRLYTSPQGGFIIDGKATAKAGKFEVVIDACAGVSLDTLVMLRPGERRVIKLTDAAPHGVFLAFEAPLTEQAAKRSQTLKANVASFRLELNYHGDEDKPFYRLVLTVPAVNVRRSNPFYRYVQIEKSAAIAIINDLARSGLLDEAVDLRSNVNIPQPSMPGYTMTLATTDLELQADLGWGLTMLHRLDALREVVPKNGKPGLDLLLGRLSGLRARWEAEDPPFQATTHRADRIRFVVDRAKTIVDISSPSGIGRSSLRRESRQWPDSVVVRLHLNGLERFAVSNGEVTVEWLVSGSGEQATSKAFLRSGDEETRLDATSPYHTPARIVGGNGKIPLEGGYFEVLLPAHFFRHNPEEIALEWVDFFRN